LSETRTHTAFHAAPIDLASYQKLFFDLMRKLHRFTFVSDSGLKKYGSNR